MKRIGFVTCLAALLVASSIQAQDYVLGFSGCADAESVGGGGDFEGTVTAAITAGPEVLGIQGWSLSVGGNGVGISDATIDGTAGAESDEGGLRDGGFEKTELTTGDGNEGAVSAIVLSFTQPIVLDNIADADLLVLTINGVFPALDAADPETPVAAAAGVDFVDGRQGSGQPVSNNLTVGGATVKPSFDNCAFNLIAAPIPPVCPPVIDGEQAAGVVAYFTPAGKVEQDAEPLFGLVDGTDDGLGPAVSDVRADSVHNVYVALSSNLQDGIQGWSLSVALGAEGDVTIGEATTVGTAGGETDDGGVRDGGFEKTENVDPTINDQGPGVVSAVVCSFTQPITLEPRGTGSALIIPISGAEGASASASFQDGLTGSGQPVNNVATVAGATVSFLCAQTHNLNFVKTDNPVQRGEANGDGRTDLADPIYTINFLFRNGPGFACEAAADANGDGMTDLSDATFVVAYLFLSGPAPASVTGGDTCELIDASMCAESSPGCDA